MNINTLSRNVALGGTAAIAITSAALIIHIKSLPPAFTCGQVIAAEYWTASGQWPAPYGTISDTRVLTEGLEKGWSFEQLRSVCIPGG